MADSAIYASRARQCRAAAPAGLTLGALAQVQSLARHVFWARTMSTLIRAASASAEEAERLAEAWRQADRTGSIEPTRKFYEQRAARSGS